MNTAKARSMVEQLLSAAGIHINGSNPWDIQVYNEAFFNQAVLGGSLRVGEAYVKKWWDCLNLDEFYHRVLRASIQNDFSKNWRELAYSALTGVFNFQTLSRSMRSGRKHYDLGNELFANMLDKRLVYTCGYWKDAATLDEAQEKKLALTCSKLNLQPGMHVLDIGCGWGSFARFAAEKFGVEVTGITISEEQMKFGRKLCADLPVDIRLLDYRLVKGKYDRIVSLGMFEHVGYRNYRTYMRTVHRCLTDNGIFLLHTIGGNISRTTSDPWLNRYIFPGSMLPSIQQIGKSTEGLFVMEDWHNFSADYDKTLMAWHGNFVSNWGKLRDRYDEKFYRMWNYYLLSCAGSFRARKNQLWQIVLSKSGVPGGYLSVR